jgi:hypothetical protein
VKNELGSGDTKVKMMKISQHKRDPKIIFSIEIKQDYNLATEITALPSSFN